MTLREITDEKIRLLLDMMEAPEIVIPEADGTNDEEIAALTEQKALQEQEAYFKSALPYFVKLRELEPESVSKWGVPLQTLYYMLKMSKELNEVEARMKEKGML